MVRDWHFSFAFVVLMTSWVVSFSIPRSDLTDQTALLALKSHLDFDPFLARNWSTATSFYQWVGVSCSARHNRVAALNLSSMNLKGTLPPQIGDLSFLVSIDLSNNTISGALPKELGHLSRLKFVDLGINNFSGGIPSILFPSSSKLQYLFLPNNSLTGTIPASLFNITTLKTIDFMGNFIQGSIPQEIGFLANLQILRTRDNQLSGAIPYALFNSSIQFVDLSYNELHGSLQEDICSPGSKLEYLNLGRNKLYGRIPNSLYKCGELQRLGLFYNNFIGSIPTAISNLTKLERLLLGANGLTGQIPQGIGYLVNLQKLGLEGNHLQGNIPFGIGNCTSLIGINLGSNNLTGHLPSSIGQLPNLQEIYLAMNQVTGQIPDSICNTSELVALDLSVNAFSGFIPESFGHLRNLRYFVITGNFLTSKHSSAESNFLSSLTNCKSLVYLWLDENPLDIVLPRSIGNLSVLRDLSAAYSGIKGTIPIEIGNLSSLIGLTLINNEVTGNIPTTIGRLQNLQSLLLTTNQLEGPIPYDICYLVRLSNLYLDGNKLSGSLPECLSNLTSLRLLDVGSNGLNDTIPPHYWNLKDILYVNMSVNSLSGSLPLGISNLKVASIIDLSRNKLSGDIPTSIGDLQDLNSLHLSDNSLQGHIPDSLGKLINLESLDLSSNSLSGEIPKSLEKLSHLMYLNLSFNQLQGKIPDGGPFANFTAQSFTGNAELCGSNRLQVPKCRDPRQTSKRPRILEIFKYLLPVIAFVILMLAFTTIFLRCRQRGRKPSTQEDVLPLPALRRISYHEIELATNGFQESNLLGSGSFGSVYKGILSDGTNIAIKVFNVQDERARLSFDRECEVLRSLRHRNLAKIISSCTNLDFKALVLEFMPNLSLEQWLYSDHCFLDVLQRLNIVIDVASALEYLHNGYSIPVVHCDLKPSNVLLDEDMVAHVADFGISKLLGEGDSMTQTMTLATVGYMPPEYGSEGIVSTQGDVYSFGVLLMETFTAKKPTDQMFAEQTSLRQWVKQSLPYAVTEVVDNKLLSQEDKHCTTKKECLVEILQLALKCSADLPQERLKMKEMLSALKKIKTKVKASVDSQCQNPIFDMY